MAESLPTSVSAFNHRRPRADSTTSFSFYQDNLDDEDPYMDGERTEAGDLDDMPFDAFEDDGGDEIGDEESSSDLERQAAENDYVLHRRTSNISRGGSIRTRLLRRESGVSAGSGYGGNR